jgi:hypothetical protein
MTWGIGNKKSLPRIVGSIDNYDYDVVKSKSSRDGDTMKIEIDVEMPEGYEATGEYRRAILGEYRLEYGCALATTRDNSFGNGSSTLGEYLILRKKKRKKRKKRKMIVFVPVGSFEEATSVPSAGSTYRYYLSERGNIASQVKSSYINGETWLRREEREEA